MEREARLETARWTLAAVAFVVLAVMMGAPSRGQENPGTRADGGTPVATYGLRARGSYRANDSGRPTVCLVHGMNSTSAGFVHLIPLLESAGYGVVLYDYPYDRGLEDSARAFEHDWMAFRRRFAEVRPWIVVTHSMGGLLARAYVEGDGYAGDVSDLILLAPPNHGSAIAELQSVRRLIEAIQTAGPSGKRTEDGRRLAALASTTSEAAKDLAPGSAFLRQLNARRRRSDVRYHTLAGNVGFLDREGRQRIESQLQLAQRAGGLLGGLSRLGLVGIEPALDEVSDGTGDGCVSLESTRLEGVTDHVTIPANHVEIIRGPLLYPEPGPVACWPDLLRWLEAAAASRR